MAAGLSPWRTAKTATITGDTKVAITIPSPSTIPDPQAAIGIATTDAVRLTTGN